MWSMGVTGEGRKGRMEGDQRRMNSSILNELMSMSFTIENILLDKKKVNEILIICSIMTTELLGMMIKILTHERLRQRDCCRYAVWATQIDTVMVH